MLKLYEHYKENLKYLMDHRHADKYLWSVLVFVSLLFLTVSIVVSIVFWFLPTTLLRFDLVLLIIALSPLLIREHNQ